MKSSNPPTIFFLFINVQNVTWETWFFSGKSSVLYIINFNGTAYLLWKSVRLCVQVWNYTGLCIFQCCTAWLLFDLLNIYLIHLTWHVIWHNKLKTVLWCAEWTTFYFVIISGRLSFISSAFTVFCCLLSWCCGSDLVSSVWFWLYGWFCWNLNWSFINDGSP